MALHRYWIRFDTPGYLSLGCGVTAPDHETALKLIREKMQRGEELPPIVEIIDDVDISTLDSNHVLPNMWTPSFFGIWFPLGLQENTEQVDRLFDENA